MTRDHFAKGMRSPNFEQAYQKTPGAKIEKTIEKFLNKIIKKVKSWKE